VEMRELEEMDELVRNAAADEKTKSKRVKRKEQKERTKQKEREEYEMNQPQGDTLLPEDLELFSLKKFRRKNDGQLPEERDYEKPAADEKKKVNKLTPEELAMGEQLIYSSKTDRDLEDWGWNRYTNNDSGLPEWFVEDEAKHCRKELPVSKDRVDFYKQRQLELNVRPIKKVVEAKMRKKKRKIRQMEKAKKRANNLAENPNLTQGERLREMRSIYKKAMSSEKRDVKYQVMTKGKRGRLERPSGAYRVVDKRLKKDNRKLRAGTKRKHSKRS